MHAPRRPLRQLALTIVTAISTAFPVLCHAHGDAHERIAALTAELNQKPDNPDLYLQRGELHRLHEEWAAAEADFARAEKLDPKLASVWLARARLHLATDHPKEAEAEIQRFLTAHPKHFAAITVRAQALFAQKKFLEAAEAWQQVIDTAPSADVEHFYQRARSLSAAGAEHVDEALRTLDAGLAKLGSVPTIGLFAVELEVGRQRYDKALERIDRLMPKVGRKETWRELRGDILLKAGKPVEAQEEYTRALEELAALPARIRSTKAGASLEERLRSKRKQ